jgi:hypothetical protein
MTMQAFATTGHPEEAARDSRRTGYDAPCLEARRREIRALLDDIRSREPTSTEVAQVIAQECEGQLHGDRLHRLAARIVAAFRSK